MNAITNRYEFVYLFDVENGNPNGDPDAGNMPRLDPETNHGIVTDVCLKRKIRNYVAIRHNYSPPHEIFVKEGVFLNEQIERAYVECDKARLALDAWKKAKTKKEKETIGKHPNDIAKDWMCQNFFDVRTFGAVMTTGDKAESGDTSKLKKVAGQVRGPVQFNFARSIEPITPLDLSISVIAARSEDKPDLKGVVGRKPIVPYALYRAEGYVSANLAGQTGFTEDDLALLWESLINMFDHDHSAARGKMNARRLIVFKHDSALGNAPAHKLFERVSVKRVTEGPARAFSDYGVTIDQQSLPSGVTLTEMV
ncbi:MAG TPA: type I-C CRISPR-associated protein Cas7/Csd2 [Planctomycetota bacterium]|nr:type I-C CRISPR-associated protein Cas7/Csd2 [Planctomycetota bacterium]